MIDCKHSWPMIVTNRGFRVNFCGLLAKHVNDDICFECKHREGETPKIGPEIKLDYPRRSDEEIAAVYEVCKGCPLHHLTDKTCGDMTYEPYPTDTLAQHPSNHCPKKLW